MAQFTNQAQLRYGNSVTNSNIAVGEILEVLSISKTAVKNTYHPGGTVTYIISIVNSGTNAGSLQLLPLLGAGEHADHDPLLSHPASVRHEVVLDNFGDHRLFKIGRAHV